MRVLSASRVQLPTLAEVFNQAFSDYYVEVFFNATTLGDYLYRNMLDLGRSLLVEEDGHLVGVLLCGDDGRVTWNAGMGIHPRWRRRGLGSALLDRWLADATARGVREAVLEVVVANLGARYLYRSRGFQEGRTFQGFEGRPGWKPGPTLPPGVVERTTPAGILPIYRTCHSFQKRREVLLRLRGFTCLRTSDGAAVAGGPGYLVCDDYGGMLYVFDVTPNAAGRALLEGQLAESKPRLVRVVNACDATEEGLWRSLGFRPWVRNMEMRLELGEHVPEVRLGAQGAV